ncbi:Uracil-DNA glycosylase superfamily protein [Candidatus Filomicrobium marinum]|uniref:Type-5 uracil-DNA glycosylase n=1 Tax=Candidatus Filomicrobium marinum TaxID=1608628 RepID=A0A0D6JID6_9HYPH|nr:Uracil-DNA glycosylase superfamily protein [Candidatus Filomicrobium marinum]CPR21083.1 Uracil-DNA glycosylase superfamily protein [Candidatus Filomicrobium marinum]
MRLGTTEERAVPQQITPEPPHDCALCPRLVAYRNENKRAEPGWYNGAVGSFGEETARLLIVGLAPGRGGANRTGRPFTGDYAGDLLYATLLDFGFAEGSYQARPDDGLELRDCMITNAVRCVPPENKPTGVEISTCRQFFSARMETLPNLSVILALGRIAHDQTLSALALRKSAFKFGHGARHELGGGRLLFDSFHCSRYNTNTGRLTTEMFHAVFDAIRRELDQMPPRA